MTATFYCHVDTDALEVVEFYKTDIEILKELGYQVRIATKYREIDWHSDVVFIWWWTYAFWPVIMSKWHRSKVIITGTFNFKAPNSPVDYFRRPLWQRWLIRSALKNADANILVSSNEFDQISKKWDLKNLYYSPHVIDTTKYEFSNKRSPNLVFSIIWTGSINLVRKCLPEIIKTAKIINRNSVKCTFLIAGRKGDGWKYAQDLIEEENVGDSVSLIGEISIEEKIRYMQTCAVYLQPSRYEGFGLAVAEAMSCGAPILTTKAGEVAYVVNDAGIVLEDCNPSLLATNLMLLLEDAQLRSKLGRKARERIEKMFYKDRRKENIKAIIERL